MQPQQDQKRGKAESLGEVFAPMRAALVLQSQEKRSLITPQKLHRAEARAECLKRQRGTARVKSNAGAVAVTAFGKPSSQTPLCYRAVCTAPDSVVLTAGS